MQQHEDCEPVPRSGSVDIENADERRRWAATFHVTEDVLVKAVRIVGSSAAELRKLFCPGDQPPLR